MSIATLEKVKSTTEQLEELGVFQDKPFIHSYIQRELENALPFLNENWKRQDNKSDQLTRFIYWAHSYDDLLYDFKKAQMQSRDEIDFNYVIHRWYNYKVSKTIEAMFTSYNICRAEENKKHKEIDFYIYDVPFDLKVTVLPNDFFSKPNGYLNKRSGRNDLIEWFYINQSQEQRMHIANRLFVVCQGEDNRNSNLKSKQLKSSFDLIHKQVENFLLYTAKQRQSNPNEFFNTMQLHIGGKKHTPLAEALIIKKP